MTDTHDWSEIVTKRNGHGWYRECKRCKLRQNVGWGAELRRAWYYPPKPGEPVRMVKVMPECKGSSA